MATMIKDSTGEWVTVAGGHRMWVGTKKALSNALQAGEIEDGVEVMVTDDYEENVTYSETETVIGKYVDGKPVYRKVIAKNYVMTTDGTGADASKAFSTWTDPNGGTHGVSLGHDFMTASALSIDTLINVGGVVKVISANNQQWNITPGVGHQSVIATPSSLTTKNYGYIPRVSTIIVSIDGYVRFWLYDPEVILNNNPLRTYTITAWVEYTKTTD